MKIYDYFFYRLYILLRKKQDEAFGVWGTSIVLSVLIYFNLYTLSIFLYKKNLIPQLITSKAEIVAIALILFGANFYFFYRNKRYKIIEQKYSTESKTRNTIGNIGMILFIVLTFVLFFIIA